MKVLELYILLSERQNGLKEKETSCELAKGKQVLLYRTCYGPVMVVRGSPDNREINGLR